MFLCIIVFNCSLASAKGAEKIGVLYSYKNVEFYKGNNIIGFNQVWESFLETFEETYFDYQFICNISSETKLSDLGVSVIFFPLAIDISLEESELLNQFVNSGGKLVITSGVGPISSDLKSFLSKNGILVNENKIAKRTLKHKVGKVLFELLSGNFYSVFEVIGPNKRILTKWKEINEIAIGGNKSLAYIGYSWGQTADSSNDVEVLLNTLDYFWSGIASLLTKEIRKEEYEKILKGINAIQEEASSVIKIADELNLSVPRYQLVKHFDNGIGKLKEFNSNYIFGDNLLARRSANSAKNEFAIVYSLGIPVKKVEMRAIWLDRGTIVGVKNPAELVSLIKNLARAGFNQIFFETINAGYPIYPSEILPQNPLVSGWDPLKIAIDAAHTYGIELHAWVWTFAVGNTNHNLLIGQPVQYPGPVISTKGTDWALTSESGDMRIEMQPEFWVSPASKEACNFLIELFSEIVTSYDIDGLQLDYIRFPFQKEDSQAGFDLVTRNAFKEASGKLPVKNGPVNKIWNEWKVKIVTDFVKDVSFKIKQIKPDLKISAAVFGIDHSLRMRIINQDWESWLLNKWVDAVYPFYYSYTKEEIELKLERAKENINYRGIIIPAFNLRVIDVGELAERVTQTRYSGTLGLALFAVKHLDNAKKELLQIGPFREETALIPYRNPLLACRKLLDEFFSIIEKFTITKTLSVLASSQTQKEVYLLTTELKNDFKNYSPEKLDNIEKKIIDLQLKVKDWLSLEKYLDRNQRAAYISTYLDQIRTLVNYMKAE